MKKVLIMPAIALVLSAAACGDDPAKVDTRPSVRFFNATPGLAGNGGFTTNGQFAAGSALAFGQSAQTCSRIDAGSTSFGFGVANTGGTGLSGNALATLNDQSITDGGNYTVVAAGSATTHQATLFMLDNNFSGSLASNQAAVRFVNFAPDAPFAFAVFTGVLGSGGTLTANNIALGAPTAFNTVTSGSNQFTILYQHAVAIEGPAATLNFQAGSVNTIAIVPNTSGGFQLINIPRCS